MLLIVVSGGASQVRAQTAAAPLTRTTPATQISPAPPPLTATSPLTLDQAIAEALDHNLGLLAERYGVTIAAAGVITARLRPNPVFNMGADHLDWLGTHYDSENNAGPPEYSVRADVPIERGGKRESRIAVAQEGQHLRSIMSRWVTHYNRGRPHSRLGAGLPEPPIGGAVESNGHELPDGCRVVSKAILGGLHHEYRLESAA
jgi:hypothetical protein